MADYSGSFSIDYDEARSACSIRFRCFDTPNAVCLYGRGAPDFEAEALLLEARRRCLELHRLWSFSLPESDVSRLNRASGRVRVSEPTAKLLAAMKEFNAEEPTFDFTVGPVSYLWKHAAAVPSAAEIADALEHVGADKVDIEGCEIVKRDPLVQVDVGGAAKGYAADMLAGLVREAGVRSADIDLGGNLYMIGSHPSGRPWRVSVRNPLGDVACCERAENGSAGFGDGMPGEGSPVSFAILEVTDKSVVTSGSYERFVEIGGVRYQHIVDARSGWPSASDVVSATVVAGSSLRADMLATTSLLVDPEGLEARHPSEQFVFIRRDSRSLG